MGQPVCLFLEAATSVYPSFGCQDSLFVPLDTGSAFLSVFVYLLDTGSACWSVCLSFRPSAAWPICWSVAQLVAHVTAVFLPSSGPAPRLPSSGAPFVCLRLSHPQLLHLLVSAFLSVCSRPSVLPLTALGPNHSSSQQLPRSAPSRNCQRPGGLSSLHCGPGLGPLQREQRAAGEQG